MRRRAAQRRVVLFEGQKARFRLIFSAIPRGSFFLIFEPTPEGGSHQMKWGLSSLLKWAIHRLRLWTKLPLEACGQSRLPLPRQGQARRIQVFTSRHILWLCLASASPAFVSSPAFAVAVAGFTPVGYGYCSDWVKDRFNTTQINYVFGYITAAAIYSGKDTLRGLTDDDFNQYIDRYCTAHPEDTITKAADKLFETKAGRQ
jgi:hypothetical protein